MNESLPSVRQRLPLFRLAGVFLLVASTVAGAAANMIPFHIPTAREQQRAEQLVLTQARRTRIAAQLAAGDHCDPDTARELARDLVFDGRSAVPYADDYARRCSDDWIVRRWANASITLRLPRVTR